VSNYSIFLPWCISRHCALILIFCKDLALEREVAYTGLAEGWRRGLRVAPFGSAVRFASIRMGKIPEASVAGRIYP